MKKVIKFVEKQNSVEFHAVRDCPGFSHRVVINGAAVDWHGSHERVSFKSARFFLDKHSRKGGK